MEISIFAFLYYAEEILECQSGLYSVLFLRKYLNILESTFLVLSATDRDTSKVLKKGIAGMNVKVATKFIFS